MRWAISASDNSVRRRKRNSRIFARMDFSAEGLTAGVNLQNNELFRELRARRGRKPDAEVSRRTSILAALEEAGFVAGRNAAIEYRFAEGRYEHLPMLASDLVRGSPTLLVATDRDSALAVKAATTAIPIVFGVGEDPVQLGLVTSLNRPGG